MVVDLEGALGPENVEAAVNEIMKRGGSYEECVVQHSLFPLYRYIKAHGSADLFVFEVGKKSPIEMYLPDPSRVLTEHVLPQHIVLSAFLERKTKDKYGRLFRKALPGPCVVRNLMRMMWDFCLEDNSMYKFLRNCFECSLLGMYRTCKRRDFETRFKIWCMLQDMSDSEFRLLLNEKNQLLFFFILKEYVCYAVRGINSLYEQLCLYYDWAEFEEKVVCAMDKVRSRVNEFDFDVLREYNKSKQIFRHGTNMVDTLASGANEGDLCGKVTERILKHLLDEDSLNAEERASLSAFKRFCALKINCVMYQLPRHIRDAQRDACARRKFSGKTFICFCCRTFKGFVIEKKKTKRGVKIQNMSAYGSKEVARDLDDGKLYCSKSKGKQCGEPLVEIYLVGYMLLFYKKMYTVCPSCGCFMVYTGAHYDLGFYCGHCRVNNVFLEDLCCKFCTSKEKLTTITAECDGEWTDVYLCGDCRKVGKFIDSATGVLKWETIKEGLENRWPSLKGC